jgi:hypothetical protein
MCGRWGKTDKHTFPLLVFPSNGKNASGFEVVGMGGRWGGFSIGLAPEG